MIEAAPVTVVEESAEPEEDAPQSVEKELVEAAAVLFSTAYALTISQSFSMGNRL